MTKRLADNHLLNPAKGTYRGWRGAILVVRKIVPVSASDKSDPAKPRERDSYAQALASHGRRRLVRPARLVGST
jgi:hypothetical protein